MTTLDEHKVPACIRNSLPCVPLRPCTEKELEKIPHVILTSDKDWDPTVLDCEDQLDD